MDLISVKGRRICLIGGAGFIGHNLALKLDALGAEVSIIDGLEVNNLVSLAGNLDKVPHPELSTGVVHERLKLIRDSGVQLYVQDARDYHALSKLIRDIEPEVMVQLAAVSHANRSNKDPYSTFDHSFRTLENALDAARGCAVKHFVFMSSSMVYGNFVGGEVDEQTPCEPLGIYGALKYSGEKIVIAYNQVFGLPYTIIRPSALYGERCISRRVGQIFIENALMGKDISIDGDGSDGLDFTYIDDLVAGLVRVMEHPAAKNEVFNMTYGESRTIGNMAEIVRQHFPSLNIHYKEKDKLMPDRGTLCMEKARSVLGFESSWELANGYPRYINWYKDLAQRHPEFFT